MSRDKKILGGLLIFIPTKIYKQRIEKYKEENRDRILKKQKEYNDTKRKGRGVNK